MEKRFEKPHIWMDITCGNCGGMLGRYYHNSQSVAKLKEEAHLWRYDNILNINLCQNCLTKLGGNK